MSITVEISPGELVDRITILEIKSERMRDEDKRRHVQHELALSAAARDRAVPRDQTILERTAALKNVNARLREIEDAIRDCERARDFGPTFIELARSVYKLNDERAAVKREINLVLKSGIVEEKSYQPYR